MPQYAIPPKAVSDVFARMMRKHHAPLVSAEATIRLLFAKGDGDSHPVKAHGYPALAVCRVLSGKDRACNQPDAEVVIDAGAWDKLTADQRDALADHELQHLEVAVDDAGKTKIDDYGRPVLRLRLHDHEIGLFTSIIERHGVAAPEAQSIRRLFGDAARQLLLPFTEPEPVKTK